MRDLRHLFQEVDREDELGMSVDDIEHVKERGRWWLIGSAWNEASHITSVPGAGNLTVKEPKFDKPLLDLAKKAKMNTSVRRDVFCTLMSSKVGTSSDQTCFCFIMQLLVLLLIHVLHMHI